MNDCYNNLKFGPDSHYIDRSYDGAIIKNHKYWPKGIPGDEIDRNFHNRDVGGVGVLEAIT